MGPPRLWGPSEFFKNPKCPILTQERQISIFIQKLVWCPKLAGTRVRSDSDQLQTKMALMVAISNFLVLQPLVPFMRHHSEKKNGEKHHLNNFKFTFSPFSCLMLPSYTVLLEFKCC